ncbi:Predicted chitinase [Serratia fonticola]|uniref:glycoside hydrolase family 19 protein n=1 Tax=Serratia fonticola TaxID=47917 RepID=UPI00217B1856|nr:glycoside hydrolase family 19 protein [Serratia fonticola]CAI1071454.1 Predicted chitinase [Serratia fonticola]
MTQNQFQRAAGISAELAARWYPHLVETFKEFNITKPVDQAMFIAQVGHESSGFKVLVESFNYSVDALMRTFGPLTNAKRLSEYQCKMLGRTIQQSAKQEAIANLVYGGRMGNSAPGDGWKYRGRGLKQLTGLNNHLACGTALKLDLVSHPELLEQDVNAMRSAGWFWSSNKCGQYGSDVVAVTKAINGGLNGIDDRKARFEKASKVLL